jgi:hypothetical protein
MNLFRSEEHVRRRHGEQPAGATIGVVQLAELAQAWWGDRLACGWRPHTRGQNQAILESVGLAGSFWRLP